MAKQTKDTGDERDKEGPRSFSYLISQLGDGDVHRDLSTDLHDLVATIREHSIHLDGPQKIKGVMTIKIGVECDARGVVGIDVDTTVKKPKRKRAKAQAWITAGGNLTIEHPRQQKLPLQEVGRRGAATEIADNDGEAMEL